MFEEFRGVWVFCGQTCVLTIKVCTPTCMDSGKLRGGGTSRGLSGGVVVVGRLEGLCCRVGDAKNSNHKSPPYWSSALPIHTSCSRVSIMNRSKVQLWHPPSAPS